MNPTMQPSADLAQGRLFLEQTRCYAIGAIKGVTEAQWVFRPSAEQWSIAQLVEHIVSVNQLVVGPIRQQLAESPVCEENPHRQRVDELTLNYVSVRLAKFPAPPVLTPAGQWSRAEAVEQLNASYARLVEFLESEPDLRLHFRQSPPLKAISKGEFEMMDGYQWILAAGAHCERHTKQILELKANPEFPD